jgi:hypothetical protein
LQSLTNASLVKTSDAATAGGIAGVNSGKIASDVYWNMETSAV